MFTPGQRAHLPLHIPSYSIVGKYPGGGITGDFHPRFYAKMPGFRPGRSPACSVNRQPPKPSGATTQHHGPQVPSGTHRAPPNPDVHCSTCAARLSLALNRQAQCQRGIPSARRQELVLWGCPRGLGWPHSREHSTVQSLPACLPHCRHTCPCPSLASVM